MKAIKLTQLAGLSLIIVFIFALGAAAQDTGKGENIVKVKSDSNSALKPANENLKKLDAPESAETPADQTGKTDNKNLRNESESEEAAAILPYYNNYMKEYRLGPQDVISIEVFGQCPDYCKAGINIPPTARISYPLIREGIFVGGKTVEQIQEEITKKLDEYIIDPKVTVTLEKVGSARYSVLGDVGTPGVKLMERRLSVYEAIVEAGGILRTGDKKRVVIYRQTQNGITPLSVNLEEVAHGKAEMVYLVPGDQVIVPGNRIKMVDKVFDIIGKLSIVRLLFGSPF